MIFRTLYVRCDACYSRMYGIMSDAARKTCQCCGGRAIIGEMPTHQALVRRAKERLDRWEQPMKPRTPGRPGGREAA